MVHRFLKHSITSLPEIDGRGMRCHLIRFSHSAKWSKAIPGAPEFFSSDDMELSKNDFYRTIMNEKFPFIAVLTALLMACSPLVTAAEIRQDLLGDSASTDVATRTIGITSNTRYVHVEGGEIIRFVAGDKTFNWNFNGPLSVSSFDLRRVAPGGVLSHEVQVIIAPNPRYMSP